MIWPPSGNQPVSSIGDSRFASISKIDYPFKWLFNNSEPPSTIPPHALVSGQWANEDSMLNFRYRIDSRIVWLRIWRLRWAFPCHFVLLICRYLHSSLLWSLLHPHILYPVHIPLFILLLQSLPYTIKIYFFFIIMNSVAAYFTVYRHSFLCTLTFTSAIMLVLPLSSYCLYLQSLTLLPQVWSKRKSWEPHWATSASKLRSTHTWGYRIWRIQSKKAHRGISSALNPYPGDNQSLTAKLPVTESAELAWASCLVIRIPMAHGGSVLLLRPQRMFNSKNTTWRGLMARNRHLERFIALDLIKVPWEVHYCHMQTQIFIFLHHASPY